MHEFHRCAFLSVITEGANIAGFSIHCHYDLREKATLNHPYGQGIAIFRDKLDKLPNKSIYSIEYLTVAPDYRDYRPRLAEMLIRLAVLLAKSLGAGAVTGVARKDRRVDVTAESVGFETLGEAIKYNNACGVVYFDCRKDLTHTDESDSFISSLTNNQTTNIAA
nr:hypothetical protein BdHM001_36580 [Bdellovibrio sp. HM001]